MHGHVTVDAVLTCANGMTAMGVVTKAGRACVKGRLPVAAQAGRGLARDQEFVIDRTMRIMADAASVAYGIMLEHKGSPHFLMTLETTLIAIV